jgi:hypothetical protein
MQQVSKYPIRKAHTVGSSVVVTIDPSHVKRLKIDEMTFFVQKSIQHGIVLEVRRLQNTNEREEVVGGEVLQTPHHRLHPS